MIKKYLYCDCGHSICVLKISVLGWSMRKAANDNWPDQFLCFIVQCLFLVHTFPPKVRMLFQTLLSQIFQSFPSMFPTRLLGHEQCLEIRVHSPLRSLFFPQRLEDWVLHLRLSTHWEDFPSPLFHYCCYLSFQ